MTELPFEKCFHTRSQGFLGIIQDFILSYCLAVTYRITCYCDDRHTSVRILLLMTTSVINAVVLLCGGVCFSEEFRMRAVLFRTAGQGIRIHWSVF